MESSTFTSTLLQTLLLASGGILSVGSITIVILLLLSDRGWRGGLGYALGYTGAYSLIGLLVTLIGYRVAGSSGAEPGLFLPILLAVLGSLLIWLAVRNGRRPPPEGEQKPPRFFAVLDGITPLKAFGFGAPVTVLNFKNLAI